MADYIAKLGMKVETDGAAKASADLDRVSASSTKATAAAGKFKAQAATTGKATSQLGYKASQAGYQVSDLAVQLEMGTPFVRAFGQQASQLLAVFGPAGILAGTVIAVGAAVGGVLVNAFKDATIEVERFELGLDSLLKKTDELRIHQTEWAIEQVKGQIGAMKEMGSQTVVTASRIETLEGNLKRFPGNSKAEDWRKELLKLKAETEGTEDQAKKLTDQLTALQTRLEALRSGAAASKTKDDLKDEVRLQEYVTAALIKHNQIMEGIRAATLAKGQAEDAALIALHDGQRAYELEQERNYYANAAADYVQFLTNKKEASQDHVDSIDDTENAQLQRRADAYTGFLTRRAVETESFWEDQKNQYQDDTSAAIKAEQDKLDAKAALSNAFQTLMTSESRALFEIGKAGAISETIVNTQVAAMKAFSQLGVFGAPAAAAIVAAGAVRIGKIASTQFGSRSMGSDTVPNIPTSAGQGGNTQQVSINITGGSFGAGAGDDVINSLRDFFSRDGVLFDGASTQGQVIANG